MSYEQQYQRLQQELEEYNLDPFWTLENKRLGAAIQAMVVAIAILKEQGYDPITICGQLCDDELNQEIIGRRLFDDIQIK